MDAKNALNMQRDLCDSLAYSCIAVISEFVEKCWERQKQQREHTPELKNSYKESGDGGK